MIYWNRFISYIYRYHNNEKNENTGFAKVQKVSDTGRINIGLKDIMNRKDDVYSVYLYRETLPEGESHEDVGYGNVQIMIPKPIYLGKLKMRGGRGEGVYTFDWNDVKASGKPITAWSGIAIKKMNPDNSQYGRDIFCSAWTDNIVDYSYLTSEDDDSFGTAAKLDSIVQEMSAANEEYNKIYNDENSDENNDEINDENNDEINDEYYDEYNEDYSENHEDGTNVRNDIKNVDKLERKRYTNAIEEMLATYERLPLLPENANEGNKIIESVKITPNDIGLLDMNNWRLGVNSFLTHGFYSYKYLLLGKVVFQDNRQEGCYVLGVPGVYSAKEKYLAGIFGFDRFVPGHEVDIKTGCFGYWLVNIICNSDTPVSV